MGILRSVALGKSRKSAGELTFYNRIGVSCFRQKPAKSPGYKATVPQRMQQSVFRFMKANVDKSGVKSFIDMFYDAKPRKGRSETKFNMFYKAFMPHLVAAKSEIYALPVDELVNSSLFLGNGTTNVDRLTNGVLGTLILASADASTITMDQARLESIIEKANVMLSDRDTPFSIDNCFVGMFGAAVDSETEYVNIQPTNVVPTLADGLYTFDLTDLNIKIDAQKQAYVALMIAGVDATGGIDETRRKFATDSALVLQQAASVEVIEGATWTYVSSNQAKCIIPAGWLVKQGLTISSISYSILQDTELTYVAMNVSTAKASGSDVELTVYPPSGKTFSTDIEQTLGGKCGLFVTNGEGKRLVALISPTPDTFAV